MSVIIPSDLVVDVMKAADPGRVRQATAKLAVAPASLVASLETPFTDVLMELAQGGATKGGALASTEGAHDLRKTPDAYSQFEGFLLRDAFESLLPEAESAAFGEGFAGGVWRSMAAEQFASVFTEHGGLGIAEILRPHTGSPVQQDQRDTQWPYYRSAVIAAYQPPGAA